MNLKAICVAGLASSAAFTSAAAGPLDAHRWKNRPVVVFAPSAGSPLLAQQRAALLARRGDLADRDIAVIEVVGNRVRTVFGRSARASAAAFRRRFGIAPGVFRALLIGKDGGVKMSRGGVLSPRRVFALIDSMPMRQQEMRRKGR